MFVKCHEEFSMPKETKAGVFRGSILEPTLRTLHIADQLNHEEAAIKTFADNTVILGMSSSSHEASIKMTAEMEN